MILQELFAYYNRVDTLPRLGWIRRSVDYMLVLDHSGECVAIEQLWESRGKIYLPHTMLLPAIGKQASKHNNTQQDSNLLWDNASFVLGTGANGPKKIRSFLSTLDQWMAECNDPGTRAIRSFVAGIEAQQFSRRSLLRKYSVVDDFDKRDPILAFRLTEDIAPIHQRPEVRAIYERVFLSQLGRSSVRGTCLVTGRMDTPLALNETVIKGLLGALPTGANIVSFNSRAVESYGKRERTGENAPISSEASFAYTTALNHLVSSDQCLAINGTTIVFWAEQPNELEQAVPTIFGEPPEDDPAKGMRAIHTLLESVQSGKFGIGNPSDRVHILALRGNEARAIVVHWETSRALSVGQRILRHFNDLRIDRGLSDSEHLSLKQILQACALQGKAENAAPRLAADVLRAALSGTAYPRQIIIAALNRAFAEQGKRDAKTGKHSDNVPYARAAIIKAWLMRHQDNSSRQSEITVSLDTTSTNVPYRLGRLFATLERIQIDAHPRINTTIRDSFFGAACANPGSVFPALIRKNQHHLSGLRKQKPGLFVIRDKLMTDILWEGLDGQAGFPAILSLEDQGRFVIGYYHQRHALSATPNASETK